MASLGWLSLTILAGLYLAAAKRWSFSPFAPIAQMHAHGHLGALGFFVMMIVAVSYKLVPMFALSEVRSARRAGWSLALLNAGLAVTMQMRRGAHAPSRAVVGALADHNGAPKPLTIP